MGVQASNSILTQTLLCERGSTFYVVWAPLDQDLALDHTWQRFSFALLLCRDRLLLHIRN